MSRKAKFNPEITRVKLNPEQAVLVCQCATDGYADPCGTKGGAYCTYNSRTTSQISRSTATELSS